MALVRLDISLALRDLDLALTLAIGRETVALVGPSGAGKTSVLRAVAGLLRPRSGTIEVGAETWFDSTSGIDLPAERRRVGMLFQEHALFPHLSVAGNVGFAARDRADELMARFAISHLARSRPRDLSGGERQRVALARALGREPHVLLLDEPTASLDARTRATVRSELREILRAQRLPTLIVTHDYEEAAVMADRIGVLVDGRIRQIARPDELVAAPADPFVAAFTGANVVGGRARRAENGLTEVALADGNLLYSTDAAAGEVAAIVHPWDVSVGTSTPVDSALNKLVGPIRSSIPIGNRVRLSIGPIAAEITRASADRLGLREGIDAVASFKASATRLVPIDRDSGTGDHPDDPYEHHR